jgi:altered-inheritance-of-mitochondria protein 5
VLTNVVAPPPPAPEPRPKEVEVGLVEMAKDRWNRELEGVVRRVYETDWRRVGERVEDRVRGLGGGK